MTSFDSPTAWARALRLVTHPVRAVTLAFVAAVALGTLLLMLPIASEDRQWTHAVDAMFTATSAVCVTGLVVVDTSGHWSTFGEVVILALIQAGGLGLMTLASLIVIVIGGRLGIRTSMLSEVEARGGNAGAAARSIVVGVIRTALVFEVALAAILTARLALGYGMSWGQAGYVGVFHGISAFNNAGFSTFSDSLTGFATDPWIAIPICLTIVAGGLGFPVWWEIWQRRRTRARWTLHTKVTLWATAALFAFGAAAITAMEWRDDRLLGDYSAAEKVLIGAFHSVQARTAGFNSVDLGEVQTQTLLTIDGLMFVGGGSAGTAGGIKLTTFVILILVAWAELRGDTTVSVGHRRIPAELQRQALTVLLTSLLAVASGTWLLMTMTPFTLDEILFEVVSAFGTVGLSTGITPDLPRAGEVILVVLMLLGRLGPITLGAALALRSTPRHYTYPEERVLVG
ncbi:MAG: potassium transporter TrkG [Dermatophilaceae bacterium]